MVFSWVRALWTVSSGLPGVSLVLGCSKGKDSNRLQIVRMLARCRHVAFLPNVTAAGYGV